MPKLTPKTCFQCQENLPLIQAENRQYYCADCHQWNQEAEQSGLATCSRFFVLFCRNCGECFSCQRRQPLKSIPPLDLMLEILQRPDYQALITWEDDRFQHRWQEIIWELKVSKGLTPRQIQAKVNQDLQRKLSRRKYSRGT